MAVVRDSASLTPTGPPSLTDTLLQAQVKLSLSSEQILGALDPWEATSVVFLSLPRHYLFQEGYKLCQYVWSGRIAAAVVEMVSELMNSDGGVGAVVEALYATGRHDILHHQLGVSVDAALHKHYQSHSSLEPDRRALYCVFSGMAQEQADVLLSERLQGWVSDDGRPLEETFLRNLTHNNYSDLLSQLHSALTPHCVALAGFLAPHLPHVESVPLPYPQRSQHNGPSIPSLDLYPLPSRYPYGLCIIINVKTFIKPSAVHDQIPLNVRHGSEVDCQRWSATFKLFGFHVMTVIDPDRHKLELLFRSLRMDPKLAAVSCLAVCIMTHGDENDNLYLHDRSVIGISMLRELCFNIALINKPRLFFIQACRGEQALRPLFLQQDVCSVTHTQSDCLISYATVHGYTAVRSQTEGSWYVSEVCRALQECGDYLPIRTVLQRARVALKDRVGPMGSTYVTQLSEEKVTLTKDVQLLRAPEKYYLEGIAELAELELLERTLEENVEQAIEEQ